MNAVPGGKKPHSGIDGEAGFSLVEMIVVLAMIALVSTALIFGARRPKDNVNPREIVREIASEARIASLRAIASGRNTLLTLDLVGRTASRGNGAREIKIPPDLAMSMTAADRLVDAGQVGRIEFFPDGSNTGGEIKLGTPQTGGYEVRVFWLTGEVTTRQIQ